MLSPLTSWGRGWYWSLIRVDPAAPAKGRQPEQAQAVGGERPVDQGREAQGERVRAAAWAPRVPLKEQAIQVEART